MASRESVTLAMALTTTTGRSREAALHDLGDAVDGFGILRRRSRRTS